MKFLWKLLCGNKSELGTKYVLSHHDEETEIIERWKDRDLQRCVSLFENVLDVRNGKFSHNKAAAISRHIMRVPDPTLPHTATPGLSSLMDSGGYCKTSHFRVAIPVMHLGWVDFNLGSSSGWLAPAVVTWLNISKLSKPNQCVRTESPRCIAGITRQQNRGIYYRLTDLQLSASFIYAAVHERLNEEQTCFLVQS